MRKKNKTTLRNTSQTTSLATGVIKKLPVLIGVIAVLAVVVLIKDVEVPAILPLDDVQVEGELHFLVKEEIVQRVKENITEGYFAVDLKKIRELLLQQPWIKNVSLRRKWPASVVVFVEEQQPLAFWNDDAYIGESGDVFRPMTIDKDLNLPHLNGPETQHANVLKFMNMLYKKMALLDYEVKSLDLDDRRAWQLVIENNNIIDVEQTGATAGKANAVGAEKINAGKAGDRIEVKLGRYETEKRLQRFINVLPALSAQVEMTANKIEVIDMRYPNGFSVQMAERIVVKIAARIAVGETGVIKQNVAVEITRNLTNEIAQGFVYAHRYATVSMSGA